MAQTKFVLESFCDQWGPAKVVYVHDSSCGLRAIIVIDNVACGPAIGGVRMAIDVSTEEVFRLARAMSLKNAAAGLPHGGGKAGILADPKIADKPRLIRAFARAIRHLVEYIPGPDMGTEETCMAIVHDEIGRAVGLPRVLGGIPLDEIGATGFGVAQCAEVAVEFCDFKLQDATLAVEGFGNVGRHAASFLVERGARLIAASDTGGTIYQPDGIDVRELAEVKQQAGTVAAYRSGKKLPQQALLTLPCDILVPAARPDCIRVDNAREIKARVILQGANIPVAPEAERILFDAGVINVPDFIANAGGVICAAAELHGASESDAFQQIASKIRHNTREVLGLSRDEKIMPREAALRLATARIQQAMHFRNAG